MAGKNITIAGATFNGVPSIDVPVSGGGTASFVEISDTTAQASDVAQGKFFYDAHGVKTEGSASGGGGIDVEALSVTQNGTYTAPSGKAYSPVTVNVEGGGGASNFVTGTFTGTTAGAAMDVTIPYTGSGYPIAIDIYPTGGFRGNSAFSNLIEIRALATWSGIKQNTTNAPSYSSSNVDNQNTFSVGYTNKSSSSSATSYTGSFSTTALVCSGGDATSTTANNVKMKSATQMSVFIHGTSNTGFAANIEYTYHIIYSS